VKNEILLPNGRRAIVKSVSFFDSGNIEMVTLSAKETFLVSLPNTKMVKPAELGFDENGDINFVKLQKDDIVIIDIPNSNGKKVRTTEVGFNKNRNFTHFKLLHGEKIEIELPNKVNVKITEITYYNTGEIKDVSVLYGEYYLINNEKVKITRVSFYITGKIEKLYFASGESITLNKHVVFPREIEYYENGEIKSILLEDGYNFSLVLPITNEKIKVSYLLFYPSMDIKEIIPLPGEIVTLPDNKQLEVSNLLLDEYGNIEEAKLFTGETKRFVDEIRQNIKEQISKEIDIDSNGE